MFGFIGCPCELHDHPTRLGGPAVGNSRRQRETGTGGEKERADRGERREQETTEGD